LVYHVLNRANARLPIFEKPADFEAFERVQTDEHFLVNAAETDARF
jgi:hypothetical protein